MKKLLLVAILMLALVFTIVACTGGETPDDTTVGDTTVETPTDAPTEESTDGATDAPTEEPTDAPTEEPTDAPTEEPTDAPTEPDTEEPTEPETKDPMEPVNVFVADDIQTVTGSDPGHLTQDCVTLEDGFVHIVPIGPDPYYYPFSRVDGARYIAVRYRTDATGADIQMYIGSTGGGPSDDSTMLRQPVVADSEWHVAIFDTQSLIDAGKYDGKYVSYFRFDALEAGYKLNENGETYKNEDGSWARYSLPEGCMIDVAYIGFFHSTEAAQKYDFEQYPPYVEADDAAAGKVSHSFDTFYVNGQMYFPEDGGAGDKLTAQNNTVTFAEGEAHDSMILRGWVGFNQPIESFGYFLDNYEFVFNPDYTKPTEDGVKAAGGEHASRFEILVPLADLVYDDHFAGFVVKLADGTVVRLRENITVSLPAAPKQDDHNFTSNAGSNFAESQDDVELKYADIADLFDQIHWGAGVPMYAKYNGGKAFYNVTHFSALHTQPTGQYAFNVNVVSTAGAEGFAGLFVRGVRIATIENHFFGQDGHDAGGVSMGGSGIYVNYVPRGTGYALRINVKTYEDGQYVPNIYYALVDSSDITVTDDGSTVSIFAGDKLAATIVISGVKDYGISTNHGATPADALAEKAVITTAEGTFELNNACVAATIEGSDLGIATRTGTFDFDRVALNPYTSVEIPTDFYVPVVRENVAEGKPVSSDNVENDANIPANATDGDTNTRYGALPNGEANLIVDLEKVYTLTGLTVSFENALWKYQIAVSEDGVDYKVIHESEAHAAKTLELELDNVAARFIKFTRLADDGATHYWFSIYEVYAYAVAEDEPEEPTPEEPTVENLVIPQDQWVISGHVTTLVTPDVPNHGDMIAAGGVSSAALLHQGSIALGEIDLSKYSKVVIMWGSDNGPGTQDLYAKNEHNRFALVNADKNMQMSPNEDTIIVAKTYELHGWAIAPFEIDLTGIDYNGPVFLTHDSLAGGFALVYSIEFVA
ncbi:MAG: discoidin domain-containing protein [Clostridia bacterium]|nr:discoidin domain-containing protein [Clostridia bacterium]